jgi:hypothetical protein
MTHLLLHKTPNSVSSEPGAAQKRKVTQWLARWIVTDELYKNTGQIHSTAKIELFYKPIIYVFFAIFVAMLFGGGVLIGKENLFEIGLRKASDIEWSKPRPSPAQSNKKD